MEKICSKCKRKLPFSQFNWKVKDIRLSSHCKDCSRKYIRDHYKKNKSYYLKKAHKRNLELRKKAIDYVGKYLISHKCIDCGEDNILVLDFDHRDRKKKDFTISTLLKNKGSMTRIIEEISKCDVRCANCHRIKTAKENRSWKYLMHS